ncbi:MAG: hypothetical protein JW735_05275 [Prolixibacteraceae bacterium]|nr:hypothetical protein [Prolixibacteraceae bacterium]
MKALLTTKRATGIATIIGAIGYLILNNISSDNNPELIDFFRGFFTGTTITTLVLFVILLITEMIKKKKH